MRKKSNRFIFVLFLAVMLLVNIAVIFTKGSISYYLKKQFLLNEIAMFFIAFVVIGVMYFIFSKRKKKDMSDNDNNTKAILFATVILFIVQVYFSYNIYFETGWDSREVVDAAKMIARGSYSINWGYFSIYPNNLFLMIVFAFIFKVNDKIGILDTESGLMPLIIVQCILISFAGFCLFQLIRTSTKSNKLAWIGWIVYLALVALSAWIVVPYSDSMGVVFPILILYCYKMAIEKEKSFFYIAILFILLGVGYLIKPQILIVGIAICIMRIMKDIEQKRLQHIFVEISFVLLVAMIIMGAKGGIKRCASAVLNEEDEFGVTHYAMMGLNNETDGVYNSSDVSFSRSFPTKSERISGNLEMIKRRINEYGVNGLVTHTWRKLLVNYGDGTFFFGGEGDFYVKVFPEKNDWICHKLRSVMLNTGEYYAVNAIIKQFLWIYILLASLGNVVALRKSERKRNDISDEVIAVAMLALIGFTIFCLLFEARSRYLFLYVPVYILVGMNGIYELFIGISERIKKATLIREKDT